MDKAVGIFYTIKGVTKNAFRCHIYTEDKKCFLVLVFTINIKKKIMSGHLSMDSVLRNNSRLLLKNKKNTKKKFFKGRGKDKKIEVKELSKEELQLLQTKIAKEQRKEKIKLLIVSTLVLIPIVWFLYSMYSEFTDYKDKEWSSIYLLRKEQKEQQKVQKNRKKIAKYEHYIAEGDKWMKDANWKNAVFFYKNAVDLFPDNLDTNYKLDLAYSYRCQYENIDCDTGKKWNEKLLKDFPEDTRARQLKSVFDKKK